jgi:hypothetical protein
LAKTGAGVEVVAEAVADEVKGEDAECDGSCRKEDEIGRFEEVGAGIVEHGSPRRGGRLHTEAEKAEGGFGEDGTSHADRGLNQHGLDDIGQDVVEHQAEIRRAERAGSLDELALLDGHDLRADEARVVDPVGERERNDEVRQAGAEEGDDGDGEKDARKRKEGVGEIDVDENVGPAFVKASERSEEKAGEKREGDDRHGDRERDAGTVERAREDVAAELIGAKPVGVRGREQALREVELCGVARGEERSEERDENEESKESDADEDHGLRACGLCCGAYGDHGLESDMRSASQLLHLSATEDVEERTI